jgi:hypothetical protein
MPYTRRFAVRCDRCTDSVSFNTTDRHEAAVQLQAAGWMPCWRKGGKLVGMCPRCKPSGAPSTGMRSTPDMLAVSDDAAAAAVLWSVRRLLPTARVVAFRAMAGAFCIECGNERESCLCESRNTRSRAADGS